MNKKQNIFKEEELVSFGESEDSDGAKLTLSDKARRKIMRRVYTTWFLRTYYARALVIAVLFSLVAVKISFFDVLRNATQSSDSFFLFLRFSVANFAAADAYSRLLLTALLSAVVALGWEFVVNRRSQFYNIVKNVLKH